MRILAVACLLAASAGALAQDQDGRAATGHEADLVAAIEAQMGEVPVFGAGIVFAREKDRLYIATANHVVRQGTREAGNLRVRVRNWSTKSFSGKLLVQADPALDLAVLTIEGLAASGADVCALPFDRLAPAKSAKRGTEVMPIGNPNGVPWAVPLRWDGILEVQENQIVFESNRLARGHSGGGLIDSHGLLVGMIQADEPPNGRALDMHAIVSTLLTWKLPVHLREPNAEGLPPLAGAVRGHNVQEVRNLLGQVCTNVNTPFDRGITALHLAALQRTPEMAKVLLDAGAAVNARNDSGETPLIYAAARGHVETVRELLQRGAEVNSNQGYRTALTVAVDSGSPEVVNLLLANHADPNLTGFRNRQTAVLSSVRSSERTRQDEILRALIAAGAKVNEADDSGDTPLTMAVESRQPATVRMLLGAGAKVAVRNRNKQSPFGLVVSQGYAPEEHLLQQISLDLLQHTSTIDSEDATRLLVEKCAREDWPDVAGLIIQRGFPVRGDAGNKALLEASERGHAKVIQVMLNAGADPDAGGQYTPLQAALNTSSGDPARRFEVVQSLVSKGAKVNVRPDNPSLDYREPLYLALISLPQPDLKVAELLLAHGAIVKPLLIETATNQKRPEAAALLKAHMAHPRPPK